MTSNRQNDYQLNIPWLQEKSGLLIASTKCCAGGTINTRTNMIEVKAPKLVSNLEHFKVL